jgi:hypothetical protein
MRRLFLILEGALVFQFIILPHPVVNGKLSSTNVGQFFYKQPSVKEESPQAHYNKPTSASS